MVNYILILSNKEVEKLLKMKDTLRIVEGTFRLIRKGKVLQMKNTLSCPTEERRSFTAFPCLVEQRVAGIKWLSYNKKNRRKGLPLITGILILNDIETGEPLSFMDASRITSMRTGALAGVASKFLAPEDSSVVSVIGCGVEGRTHIEAITALFKIKKVKAYNISNKGAEKFALEIKAKHNLTVEIMSNPRDAVRASDIICMTTSAQNPVIAGEDIRKGCLIIGTSLFRDLDPRLSKEVDKWVLGLTEIDFPHLERSQNLMKLSKADVYGDLGDVIAGVIPGREAANEKILFSCGGLGVLDICTGLHVYNKARKKQIGTRAQLL